MTDPTARPRPWLALAQVTGLVAVALFAWAAIADDDSCTSATVLGCAGPGIALALLGLPVAILLARASLRAAGASAPWVGVLFLLGCGWLLVSLVDVVEIPLVAWPPVAGALAAAYVGWVDRRVRPPS